MSEPVSLHFVAYESFRAAFVLCQGPGKKIREVFEEKGFRITKMDYLIQFPEKERTFVFTVAGKHSSPIKQVIETLSALSFVSRLEIKS